MLNIALFGPPGAGKGTQSEFLVQEYNLYHVSTGDLLRREIANKTRLGLEAQNIIATGGLARMIAKESATIDRVDHFLTLTGLRALYERNAEKREEHNEKLERDSHA